MTRSPLTTLFLLALAAVAAAHGRGGEHAGGTATPAPDKPLVGTLTTVDDRTIGVRTREGQAVTIAIEEEAELLNLERGKEVPATRGDLRVGRRVAVKVTKKGDQLTATRVVLGITAPPGETAPGTAQAAAMGHEGMGHGAMERGAGETSDAPALLRVVDAYRAALVERSVEDLGQTVTPDLLVLEGVHKNVGWPDYRDSHIGPEMKEWKRFEVLDTKTLEAGMAGSFGYVVQESAYRVVTADGPIELTAAETFVLRRSAEGWRIRHVHYSGQRKAASPTGKQR